MQKLNYVIDETEVLAAMKAKGYKSIEELSKALNVHRNTISAYLCGQRALPESLDRLMYLLDVSPAQVIVRNLNSKKQFGLDIADVVSSMINLCPDKAYVLFGSRARGSNKKYSDYDIGVYCRDEMQFSQFSKLIDLAQEHQSEKPYDINLSNLCLADSKFLFEIKNDWQYLGGDFLSWVELQKKAEIELYE